MKIRLGRWLVTLVLPLGLLTLWQWAATSGRYSESQLPRPVSIGAAMKELLNRGEFWLHIESSVQRVFIGYLIGAVLALALGSIVGLSRFAGRLFTPTIEAVRAVPSLAWVPLLILWFGIGESPKLILIAIGAFFPVFTTVVSGLYSVDSSLIEVGRAYGLKRSGIIRKIYLPAASPIIFSGLRLGLAQSWLFLVAAELIASSRGLGFLLTDSQNTGRTDIVLLAILLLAICGKATDFVVGLVESRAVAWSR